MTGTDRRIAGDALRAFAASVFVAAGVREADAAVWADALVWANLRGIDSHGVMRIPRYLDLLARKEINAEHQMRVLSARGAIGLLDADRAPGPVGMERAMEIAIERARDAGVGWCVVRNITHAGAVGRYALQAADSGMIGLVMTASLPLMAYHGSRDPVVSTNPLAIAVPTGRRNPLVLDMATSTVALGKVQDARAAGKAVPEDWGLDAAGNPTSDPARIKVLTPFAGPKGSGLSLMIECLTSVLAGNPVIAAALGGAEGTNMNGAAVALDVEAFTALSGFRDDVDALALRVAEQPTRDGVSRLLLPGDRSDDERRAREIEGIPLVAGVWDGLEAVARRVGVAMPPCRGPV